jgi:hypothetical protein
VPLASTEPITEFTLVKQYIDAADAAVQASATSAASVAASAQVAANAAGTTAASAQTAATTANAAATSAQANLTAHAAAANPHSGLSNVNNTSDASKPISTATAAALALKAPLASPTFSGTVTLPAGTVALAQQAAMPTASLVYRKTAGSGAPETQTLATLKTDLALVKADVGLGSVDNTSDASKPVSTAQATAIALKADVGTGNAYGAAADGESLRRVGAATTGRANILLRSTSPTSSTVTSLADVAGLTTPLKANTAYAFRFSFIYRTAATTTGLRMAVAFTGTSSSVRVGLTGSTAATTAIGGAATALATQVGSTSVGPGAVDMPMEIEGVIVTTGAGTLSLQLATGVNASSVTVQLNATGKVEEI